MSNGDLGNERKKHMKANTSKSKKQKAVDDSEPITKCLHTDKIRLQAEAEGIPENEFVNMYCFTCFAKNQCSANWFKE
jgi:hypothetical protein